MILDILICTIDEGVTNTTNVLIPKTDGVRYTISMQYTDTKYLDMIPDILSQREDVTVTTIPGKGLSRNRNNAIAHSQGDILLIADDDNRYKEEYLRTVVKAFEEHRETEIICFKAETYGGAPMKKYPKTVMTYDEAFHKEGYYTSSVEMAMRRSVTTTFDERFGLGSENLCAGEEEVFMKDATDAGYSALFVPQVVVRTKAETTGSSFLTNDKLQTTKGATFKHIFGTREAVWRSIKEAGFHFLHHGANPFRILNNMLSGIWTLQ